MARDVGTVPAVQKSYYRVMEALENYDAGRITATSLRDAVRLHVRTVNEARGEPVDGTLAS